MTAPIRPHDTSGIIRYDRAGNIAEQEGTSVPTDATAGYSVGAVYHKLDGVSGTTFYVNEGSVASSAFKAVSGAQVASLLVHTQSAKAFINVPLGGAILAAGTPMAAWADNAASNPGITLANSEAVGLRWNNNGTQTAVWLMPIPIPADMDITANATLKILASKTGATVGDATTFTVTAFNQPSGALHDADADFGGASSAMTGDATAKTVQLCTLTLALANLAANPNAISMSIKPTDGTLGTDDVIVHGVFIEYKRKLLTS